MRSTDPVLFSTDLGVPVYRRIGLSETDTGITRYLWRAQGSAGRP